MKPQLNLKKPASKSSSVLEGIMVIKEKGDLVLIGEVAEQCTRGGFERQRLGGPMVETEEGLRWAGNGNKGWFGWAGGGGRRVIGVTNSGVLDFLVLFKRERERDYTIYGIVFLVFIFLISSVVN